MRTWRVEADEEYLTVHRSSFFRRRRSAVANAVSNADLGFLGAPGRNPQLKIPGSDYDNLRYAERQYPYTSVQVLQVMCAQCGYRSREQHRLLLICADGSRHEVGRVAQCERCNRFSWMFMSHMPRAVAARKRGAKTVI